MDARAAGGAGQLDILGQVDPAQKPVRGDAACGTAAHETIARILTSDITRERVLAGPRGVSRAHIETAFIDELDREVGGRPIEWYERDRDTVIADRVAMIAGLVDDLHKHVAGVVLVEPAFITRCGEYWLSGHIDLVYRPRSNPDALAIADWKTGATRPSTIVLDHSWEAGVYATAVRDGWFLDRQHLRPVRVSPGVWRVSAGAVMAEHPSKYIAERECAERVLSNFAKVLAGTELVACPLDLVTYGVFPERIAHVHLADYVPYKRAGKREVRRPEDLAWYGRTQPGSVTYAAGDTRGPAWLPVRMTEHDIPRVEHRLRNVVGMIRMGRFIDQVGDRCVKCPYAGDCLTGGYGVRGADRDRLERNLTADDVTAADALAVDDA
jgi:hypothetical protein